MRGKKEAWRARDLAKVRQGRLRRLELREVTPTKYVQLPSILSLFGSSIQRYESVVSLSCRPQMMEAPSFSRSTRRHENRYRRRPPHGNGGPGSPERVTSASLLQGEHVEIPLQEPSPTNKGPHFNPKPLPCFASSEGRMASLGINQRGLQEHSAPPSPWPKLLGDDTAFFLEPSRRFRRCRNRGSRVWVRRHSSGPAMYFKAKLSILEGVYLWIAEVFERREVSRTDSDSERKRHIDRRLYCTWSLCSMRNAKLARALHCED